LYAVSQKIGKFETKTMLSHLVILKTLLRIKNHQYASVIKLSTHMAISNNNVFPLDLFESKRFTTHSTYV
jgi:hypothetical protein